MRKALTGIKAARANSSVSHLQFADNNLFFCKANKVKCPTILRIFKLYERVSSQQIIFSHNWGIRLGIRSKKNKR